MTTKKDGVGLAALSKDQIEAMGGEVDPIDGEDMSALDRGDRIAPASADDEAAAAEAAKKAEEEAAAKAAEEAAAKKAEEDAAAAAAAKKGDDDDGAPPASEDAAAAEAAKKAEEDAAAAAAAVSGKKGGSQTIPKARFDEVNLERNALRQRVKELEDAAKAKEAGGGKEAPPAYDFDAAEKQYMELMLDGKTDEALAKRREIRQAEREELKGEAATISTTTVDQTALKAKLAGIAADYQSKYPALDHTQKDYDPSVEVEVSAIYEAYMRRGIPPVEAFPLAIDAVIRMYDLEPNTAGTDGDAEADAAAKAAADVKAKAAADEAAKKAGEKKVDLAARSPPAVAGAGGRSDAHGANVIKVKELSDKEFDELPESTKARLRGDIAA